MGCIIRIILIILLFMYLLCIFYGNRSDVSVLLCPVLIYRNNVLYPFRKEKSTSVSNIAYTYSKTQILSPSVFFRKPAFSSDPKQNKYEFGNQSFFIRREKADRFFSFSLLNSAAEEMICFCGLYCKRKEKRSGSQAAARRRCMMLSGIL